jgi:hypothetical protein
MIHRELVFQGSSRFREKEINRLGRKRQAIPIPILNPILRYGLLHWQGKVKAKPAKCGMANSECGMKRQADQIKGIFP